MERNTKVKLLLLLVLALRPGAVTGNLIRSISWDHRSKAELEVSEASRPMSGGCID